jgi:translocation protein SEC63
MHLGSLGFGDSDDGEAEEKDGDELEENIDDEEDENLDKELEEKEEKEEEEKKKGPVWKKPQQKKKAKKPGKQSGKPKQKAKTTTETPATPNAEAKEVGSGSESEAGEESGSEESGSEGEKERRPVSEQDDQDEEQEWARFQKGMNRREKALSGKSRVSHSVHCPYYTDDKQEFWWVYISDRKTHSLITPPYHLTSLVSEEEVELKFTAPSKEGTYNFTVCVRSDSYLGVDLLEDIKLDVQKAWEAPKEHKQWDFSDEEDEDDNKKDESEESEYAEDSDFEDDSD